VKYPSKSVEGARKQLFTVDYGTGETGNYLWGFCGEYDATVRLTRESMVRVWRFLNEEFETSNRLGDIEGVMASELPDPEDDRYIPMGAPVRVFIDFQDRTSDESPWIFDIHPAPRRTSRPRKNRRDRAHATA
jgi:hypothetical protein